MFLISVFITALYIPEISNLCTHKGPISLLTETILHLSNIKHYQTCHAPLKSVNVIGFLL